MPVTYANYLKLSELLELQHPLSEDPDHDETLFIIVHQVYELWFKQIIHELNQLQVALNEGDISNSLRYLKRVRNIVKLLVSQMDVLETMSPVSFNAFRTRLESASGFQSAQFRMIEFMLGNKNPNVLKHYANTPEQNTLETLMNSPTIWDAFLKCLQHHGLHIPKELTTRDVRLPVTECEALQQQLIPVYINNGPLYPLCEHILDLDEGLQEWRYRHIKMVQRTIGTKGGTGGSTGAEYLLTTLMKPLFPDLWAIRIAL